MGKYIIICSIIFSLAGTLCSGQNSIPTFSKQDSIQINKIDFLNYKIETLNSIVSLQSQSIKNLNLMIQLLNIEILEMKRDLDDLEVKKRRRKRGLTGKVSTARNIEDSKISNNL